ncbi:hypothetical protein TNCV_1680841 [Trichonephila clavipes]|nr:hypothetical protein TNCV_1680841 [Trichonephila clavipes]
METYTSQKVGWSGLGHIAIRTRRVNFKFCPMATCHRARVCALRNLASAVSSRLLPVPSNPYQDNFLYTTDVRGPASKRNWHLV